MLIADLAGDDWTFQPAAGMGHALWLCGHLAMAEHLLVITRCLDGEAPDRSLRQHFPIGQPVKSVAEHDYPSPQVIQQKMVTTHAEVLASIRGLSDAVLAEPAYGQDGSRHPHYTTKLEAIAHCARHESFHAGQIATLRRLMGKAFLR